MPTDRSDEEVAGPRTRVWHAAFWAVQPAAKHSADQRSALRGLVELAGQDGTLSSSRWAPVGSRCRWPHVVPPLPALSCPARSSSCAIAVGVDVDDLTYASANASNTTPRPQVLPAEFWALQMSDGLRRRDRLDRAHALHARPAVNVGRESDHLAPSSRASARSRSASLTDTATGRKLDRGTQLLLQTASSMLTDAQDVPQDAPGEVSRWRGDKRDTCTRPMTSAL